MLVHVSESSVGCAVVGVAQRPIVSSVEENREHGEEKKDGCGCAVVVVGAPPLVVTVVRTEFADTGLVRSTGRFRVSLATPFPPPPFPSPALENALPRTRMADPDDDAPATVVEGEESTGAAVGGEWIVVAVLAGWAEEGGDTGEASPAKEDVGEDLQDVDMGMEGNNKCGEEVKEMRGDVPGGATLVESEPSPGGELASGGVDVGTWSAVEPPSDVFCPTSRFRDGDGSSGTSCENERSSFWMVRAVVGISSSLENDPCRASPVFSSFWWARVGHVVGGEDGSGGPPAGVACRAAAASVSPPSARGNADTWASRVVVVFATSSRESIVTMAEHREGGVCSTFPSPAPITTDDEEKEENEVNGINGPGACGRYTPPMTEEEETSVLARTLGR